MIAEELPSHSPYVTPFLALRALAARLPKAANGARENGSPLPSVPDATARRPQRRRASARPEGLDLPRQGALRRARSQPLDALGVQRVHGALRGRERAQPQTAGLERHFVRGAVLNLRGCVVSSRWSGGPRPRALLVQRAAEATFILEAAADPEHRPDAHRRGSAAASWHRASGSAACRVAQGPW